MTIVEVTEVKETAKFQSVALPGYQICKTGIIINRPPGGEVGR